MGTYTVRQYTTYCTQQEIRRKRRSDELGGLPPSIAREDGEGGDTCGEEEAV